MRTLKFDQEYNQIQDEKGLTVVMSFGKSATQEDKQVLTASYDLLKACRAARTAELDWDTIDAMLIRAIEKAEGKR